MFRMIRLNDPGVRCNLITTVASSAHRRKLGRRPRSDARQRPLLSASLNETAGRTANNSVVISIIVLSVKWTSLHCKAA